MQDRETSFMLILILIHRRRQHICVDSIDVPLAGELIAHATCNAVHPSSSIVLGFAPIANMILTHLAAPASASNCRHVLPPLAILFVLFCFVSVCVCVCICICIRKYMCMYCFYDIHGVEDIDKIRSVRYGMRNECKVS